MVLIYKTGEIKTHFIGLLWLFKKKKNLYITVYKVFLSQETQKNVGSILPFSPHFQCAIACFYMISRGKIISLYANHYLNALN